MPHAATAWRAATARGAPSFSKVSGTRSSSRRASRLLGRTESGCGKRRRALPIAIARVRSLPGLALPTVDVDRCHPRRRRRPVRWRPVKGRHGVRWCASQRDLDRSLAAGGANPGHGLYRPVADRLDTDRVRALWKGGRSTVRACDIRVVIPSLSRRGTARQEKRRRRYSSVASADRGRNRCRERCARARKRHLPFPRASRHRRRPRRPRRRR